MTSVKIRPSEVDKLQVSLPVWFNSEWILGISELNQLQAYILAVFEKEKLVACMPIYDKTFLAYRKTYTPLLNYYQPLYFPPSKRKIANRDLLEQLEITSHVSDFLKKEYKRIQINLHHSNYDVRGFVWAGLRTIPLWTFIYDLSLTPEFFPTERKSLRKAFAQGYYCDTGFYPECFVDLLVDMYQRKGIKFKIAKTALIHLLKRLYTANLIRQYNVMKDGRIVGSNIVLISNDGFCYDWLTATADADQKNGASIFLFNHLIESIASEFKYLDLCGANTPGPSRLKAALNAELRVFFRIER